MRCVIADLEVTHARAKCVGRGIHTPGRMYLACARAHASPSARIDTNARLCVRVLLRLWSCRVRWTRRRSPATAASAAQEG